MPDPQGAGTWLNEMKKKKPKNYDPLHELFEYYLLNRSHEDTGAFTKQIAKDYLSYLDSTSAYVPLHLRGSLLEDLEAEAREMLIKKMYGCANQSEHHNHGRVVEVAPKDDEGFEPLQPTPTETSKKN